MLPHGPPPSSEGGKFEGANNAFLTLEHLLNYGSVVNVSTNTLPPSKEGGGPALDAGGGRENYRNIIGENHEKNHLSSIGNSYAPSPHLHRAGFCGR